jgi:GNAT superfamily N-acetyltransferase
VKVSGHDAPISRHDTEEEAERYRQSYARGLARAAAEAAEAEEHPGELVELRDGHRVLVRPVRPEDKPLFVVGFDELGAESRYRRFLGSKKMLTPAELAFLTEVDHVDHEAIAAIDPFTGEGLAVARYMRFSQDPSAAEAAVVVIDAWQGRGLGSVLLERLAERAREHGIERFEATLFTDNKAMLALFERIGEVEVLSHQGQTIVIDVALSTEDEGALRETLRAAARGEVGGSGLDPA